MERHLPKGTRLVYGRALHSNNYKKQSNNSTISPIGEILQFRLKFEQSQMKTCTLTVYQL